MQLYAVPEYLKSVFIYNSYYDPKNHVQLLVFPECINLAALDVFIFCIYYNLYYMPGFMPFESTALFNYNMICTSKMKHIVDSLEAVYLNTALDTIRHTALGTHCLYTTRACLYWLTHGASTELNLLRSLL